MRNKIKKLFEFSFIDLIITIAILAVTFLICYAIQYFIADSASYSSLLFVLAIFLVSRFTKGYLFGIISAIVGSFIVNYAFTSPYYDLSFSIPTYLFTFITMILVSFLTSILTTKVVEDEKIKIDAEKEKTRSNFLRSVSHDFRTPLTTIMGNSDELSKSENLSEDDRKKATAIHDEAKNLLSMVENVLSISRINNELNIVTKKELVEELFENAVHEFKGRYSDSIIDVTIPNEIIFVDVDSKLIIQVLLNLLENAYIHGNSKKPIKLYATYDDKYVYMNIYDYGSGIDDNVYKYLNEYLFINSDSENKYKGIGLSVSNTIVKLHNGMIEAKNNEDRGAVFTIKLPVAKDGKE